MFSRCILRQKTRAYFLVGNLICWSIGMTGCTHATVPTVTTKGISAQPALLNGDPVDLAIQRAAAFLAGQIHSSMIVEDETAPKTLTIARQTGVDALAIYALLQAGLAGNPNQNPDRARYAPDSPIMVNLLKTLKGLPINEGAGTYNRALRVMVLASLEPDPNSPTFIADVNGLLDSDMGGSYTLGLPSAAMRVRPKNDPHESASPLLPGDFLHWDNLNSQYGVLGVWSAAEGGAEIPLSNWLFAEFHSGQSQLPNGQWGYQPGDKQGDYGMTVGGIASMAMCHDSIESAHGPFHSDPSVHREPFTQPMTKALAWLSDKDNCIPSLDRPYEVMGLQEAGMACGLKYFGTHDWYREVAARIIAEQRADGSWTSSEGTILTTAYFLTFLARGHHPVLMNKLRFDGNWNNNPNDVAHLAVYAGRELKTTFKWQVVDLQHDWKDWTDAPILYIASDQALQLTNADIAKLRAYVDAGGLIFTQADGGVEAFTTYVQQTLAPQLFPGYGPMLPGAHGFLPAVLDPMMHQPSLLCVTDNANDTGQILLIHSVEPVSAFWQQRASRSYKDAFDVGLQLYLYAVARHPFLSSFALPATQPGSN